MNEYTLGIADGDLQVRWSVRAGSRYEAAEISRKAFQEALDGRSEQDGAAIGPLTGVRVLVADPDLIDRGHVVEGPYDGCDRCPGCGHEPIQTLGEPCRIATRSMPVEDYHGDGSVFQPVGVHHAGWSCPSCGAGDAEPCVHD